MSEIRLSDARWESVSRMTGMPRPSVAKAIEGVKVFVRFQAFVTNNSQAGTGQALNRGRVCNAKFLLLQHLSRGEHRQGSVGGARHGISQIGTGAFATLVALAATPPRGSRASREGDRGIRGDLAACPQTLLAPCIVARGQSHLGVRFATRVNIPLDPPIPPPGRARDRGMANVNRVEADPLWSAQGPLRDRAGGSLLGGPRQPWFSRAR